MNSEADVVAGPDIDIVGLRFVPLVADLLHEVIVLPVTKRPADVDIAGGLLDVVPVRDVIGDLDVRGVVEEPLTVEPVHHLRR